MNVLGMGPMEILLIVVLALIVFGPAKLPEIMGQVGKAINDFRRATTDLSDEFNRTIQAELKETRSVVEETRSAVAEAHTSVTSALGSSLPAPTRTAPPTETVPEPKSTAAATETAAVPNGTTPEVVSNGSLPAQPSPPLADTGQWSWETAAPAAAQAAQTQAAETQAAETALAVTSASDGAASPATTQPTPPPPSAAPRPAPKRTARDELLPPY